jgi:hypothetical protein
MELRLGRPQPLLSTDEDGTDGIYLDSKTALRRDVLGVSEGDRFARSAPSVLPAATEPPELSAKAPIAFAFPGAAMPPAPAAPSTRSSGGSKPAQQTVPFAFPSSLVEPVAPAKQTETQTPDESGDVSRGFSAAIEQTPALLKGMVGFAGAAGEKALGEGGIMTALKKYGLEGYQKGMAEIGARSKDTDSATAAWEKAKQGDIGALADWAQYGIGYLGGNIAETALTALIGAAAGTAVAPGAGTLAGAAGGAVGKEAAKGVARELVQGMVAKEAARLAAGKAVTDEVTRQATKNVARNIGATVALGASGVAKSTGGVFGEAVDEAGTDNLSGADLARVFGAGVAAGLTEAAVDKLGVSAALGRVNIPGGGRVGRTLIGAAAGGGIEGGTELIQTAIERFGAAKDLTGEDAMREYIDSFALGALGGGTLGGISGAVRSGKNKDVDGIKKMLETAEVELSSDDGRQELFEAMKADERVGPILEANGIESGSDPRFQSVVTKAVNTQRLLTGLEAPSADERTETRRQREEDVRAAFGDTASTGTGVGTGATEPVIQRESVEPNPETRTLEGEARPVVLPEGETTPAGTIAMAPEDLAARREGFEVQTALPTDGGTVANRFVSMKQAETFLFGPVNKETGEREGGYASTVDDMDFRIRQGQRSKEAGGGTFFFIEGRRKPDAAQQIDAAANQAATSPANDLPQPTDKQKKAGNYKKGNIKIAGLDIAIENPRDSERSGTSPDGTQWKNKMAHHYGYVRRTKGKDGDQVDVFVGPNPESQKVFVVDQKNTDGSFDEHKVMLGFDSIEDARAGYMANYTPDWQGMGAISEMPVEAFRSWVKDGKTKRKPLAYQEPPKAAPNPVPAAKAPAPAQAPDPVPAAKAPAPAPAPAPKAPTVEQKLKQKQAEKKAEAKPAEKPAEKKAEAKPAKAPKVSKEQAVELWEDNDDGVALHMPWAKLTKDRQTDWLDAVQEGYATIELHDRLVESQLRSERAERINARVAAAKENEGTDPDAVFRVANKPRGMTTESVAAVVQSMTERWANIPQINVVQSERDLPFELQAGIAKSKATGKVPGIFWRGEAYLVADNISDARDAAVTLMHEVAGHYGLRSILGRNYKSVMEQIYRSNAAVRRTADRMMREEDLSRSLAVEEVLADMAQESASPSRSFLAALREVFAAIRQWAREKLGINFMTDNDVRQIVANARYYVTGETKAKAPERKGSANPELLRAVEQDIAAFRRKKAQAEDPRDPQFLEWFGRSRVVDKDGVPAIWYHGTAQNISVFRAKQAGAIFITPEPRFAEAFTDASRNWMAKNYWKVLSEDEIKAARGEAAKAIRATYKKNKTDREYAETLIEEIENDEAYGESEDFLMAAIVDQLPSGPNIMPMYVRAERPFDFEKKEDREAVAAEMLKQGQIEPGMIGLYRRAFDQGEWGIIEQPEVQDAIRALGYDSFYVSETGVKNLAVYDPNQLKSIYNSGEWGRDVNEISFRIKDYTSQYDDLPADIKMMALAKGHITPPTIKDRLAAMRPRMWDRVVQGAFDKFRSVKEVDLKAYMQLRLSNSPQDGAVTGLLHYGQVFNDDGALNIKKGTKGLLEILKPVGIETDRFLMWIAANRAEQLKKEDRERFFSAQEIAGLKRLNTGTMKDGRSRAAVYAETLRQMNDLNRSVLDVARSAGLINEQAYKKFSADIWYVPFYRQMEDDGTLSAAQTSSGAVGQYMSKRLRGSERQLNDLMENVLMNWSHILSASMKNQAAVTTLKAATDLGDVVTKLEGAEKGAVKVMEGGKETYYRIDDEFLLASLDAVASIPTNGFFLNIAREFKTTLTRFIALSPTFKINNLIRDSIQSIGLTDLSYNPVANVMQGYKAYENERAEALVGGGLFAMGNAFDGDQAANVKRLLKTGVKEEQILDTKEKALNYLKSAWDKYDEVSDALENANRLALYQQLRAKGATHLEASYAARDLQDFSLQGQWAAVRYLSQVVPYLNARLQGLYKLGRDGIDPVVQAVGGEADASTRQKAAKFSVVLSAVTMFGVALYLANKDDEEYKKLEDWQRDSFFWVKLPGTDMAVRIPKPFEMGAFATVIERLTEQMVDDSVEGKVFGKRLLHVLTENLAMNPMPQVFKPLYEIATNKDGFTDRPIESMGMERLSKENRINQGTSDAAVGLSKLNSLFADGMSAVTGGAINPEKLQFSPIQIDYLIRGYLGWLGSAILTTSNVVTAPFKEGESSRFERIDDFLVVGNYVKNMPQPQSKYVTSFYENAKIAATVAADYQNFINLGQIEKAQELAQKKGDTIQLAKLYARASKTMADLNKQIKLVEDDKEMPGNVKRAEIEKLQQLRADYAKQIEDARKAVKAK